MGKINRFKCLCFLITAGLMVLLCSCHKSAGTGDTGADKETGTQAVSEAETDTEAASETETGGEAASEDETDSETAEPTTEEYPYDFTDPSFFEIEGWELCLPWAAVSGVTEEDKYFHLNTVDGYAVMQGACSDGTYLYALLENKNIFVDGEKRSYCMLFKIDLATWEIVAQSEGLPVDHGNGMTYNPKTNQLVVANCQRLKNAVTFVDPDTMTVTDTIFLERDITSITYNDTYDQYVIWVKGTRDFAVLDAEFKEIAYYEGVETGLSNQNISCDDDYIYLCFTGTSSPKPGVEVFLCYDWQGNYCGAYRMKNFAEVESLIHVDDTVYAAFYTGGGRFYQLDFDLSLCKEPKGD